MLHAGRWRSSNLGSISDDARMVVGEAPTWARSVTMLAWSSTTGDARSVGSINGAARLIVGDAPTCSVGSINDAARLGSITGDARSVGSINDDAPWPDCCDVTRTIRNGG